jgi:hypothetical protein
VALAEINSRTQCIRVGFDLSTGDMEPYKGLECGLEAITNGMKTFKKHKVDSVDSDYYVGKIPINIFVLAALTVLHVSISLCAQKYQHIIRSL